MPSDFHVMIKHVHLARLFIALIFPVFILPCSAQQDYKQWLREQERKYEKFLEENDRVFAEFLKTQWNHKDLNVREKPDPQPKPDVVPVAPPVQVKPDSTPRPVFRLRPEPEPEPTKPLPPKPRMPAHKPADRDDLFVSMELDLFGFQRVIKVDAAFNQMNMNVTFNEKSIADIWEAFCRCDYTRMLTQVLAIRDDIGLNDWGYCVLLNQLGRRLYSGEKNNHFVFVWFMLIKSGYDARIGFGKDAIHLLLSSDQTLFDVSYFAREGRKYYAVSFERAPHQLKAIRTYEGAYPDADMTVRFDIPRAPEFSSTYGTRPLVFKWQGYEHSIEIQFNRNLVEFLKNHPHTEYPVYFRASLSVPAMQSLRDGMMPLIRNQTRLAAVNMLLRFVQTAFEYATDEEQFGREKPLFAEETLYYPRSDCEDRSVLFAKLVKELLGLDVIGLKYPGHVAAAVSIPEPVSGTSVIYNGRQYYVCDPTYINADAGMVMPQYADTAPTPIPIGMN